MDATTGGSRPPLHKLGFEYDGAQHEVYTPMFHSNEDHFRYRKLLDRLKDDLCREAGVLLIRIPNQAQTQKCGLILGSRGTRSAVQIR